MEWISIKEVCNLTQKSESTIRNLARKLKASKSKDIRLETLKTGHDKILFKLSFVNRELLTVKPIGNKNKSVEKDIIKNFDECANAISMLGEVNGFKFPKICIHVYLQ